MGNFTEADIKTKYILPAIQKAGWDLQTQVREEVSFTHGRIIVRGKMAIRGVSIGISNNLTLWKSKPKKASFSLMIVIFLWIKRASNYFNPFSQA
jgi:type I site-specific restriction endonuclease